MTKQKQTNHFYSVLLLSTILVILTVISCKSETTVNTTNDTNEIYPQIPDFSLNLIDGTNITKSYLTKQQTPYFFHFFSSSCPTCKSELMELKNVYEYKKYSVTVVAININPMVSNNHLKTFKEKLELPFNIAEFNSDLMTELSITERSTKIAVDISGNIIYRDSFGRGNYTQWIELFEKLDTSNS